MQTILDRLRGYNPPDRTLDSQRSIARDIQEAADEIQRLRTALEICAADWSSAPGTVMSCASQINTEFQRRMEIAAAALAEPSTTRLIAI